MSDDVENYLCIEIDSDEENEKLIAKKCRGMKKEIQLKNLTSFTRHRVDKDIYNKFRAYVLIKKITKHLTVTEAFNNALYIYLNKQIESYEKDKEFKKSFLYLDYLKNKNIKNAELRLLPTVMVQRDLYKSFRAIIKYADIKDYIAVSDSILLFFQSCDDI